MYAQVEKPKENKGMVAANSVAQKKNNMKQDFGFVDNRPDIRLQRELQMDLPILGEPPIQRLVMRIRDFKEMITPGNNTIWDSSKTMKDYPKFKDDKKWQEDIGINQGIKGKKSRGLDVAEPLILVAHGGEPQLQKDGTIKGEFGDRAPSKLASDILPILPDNYSGEVFLNGCYTGKRINFNQQGTSYMERFAVELIRFKPSFSGIVKGNLGTASTYTSSEELIEIDKQMYQKCLARKIGVATSMDKKGKEKYFMQTPFGQAVCHADGSGYTDFGYLQVMNSQ